jgi:hypothetical protein
LGDRQNLNGVMLIAGLIGRVIALAAGLVSYLAGRRRRTA